MPHIRTSLAVLAALACVAACAKAPEAAPEPTPVAAESTPTPTPAAQPAGPPPPPIEKPLEIGSQDAKDDMYCAGIIWAAWPWPDQALVPIEMAKVQRADGLATALNVQGTGKLIDQGVAHALQVGAVAGAWADVAAADFARRKPRITLDACMARAEKAAGD